MNAIKRYKNLKPNNFVCVDPDAFVLENILSTMLEDSTHTKEELLSIAGDLDIPVIDNILEKLYQSCLQKIEELEKESIDLNVWDEFFIFSLVKNLDSDKYNIVRSRFCSDIAVTLILHKNISFNFYLDLYNGDIIDLLGCLRVLRDKEIEFNQKR